MALLEVVDGALAVSDGSDDGLWVEAEIGGTFRHFDIDNGVGQRVIPCHVEEDSIPDGC